jgi:pyruvate/2-oxoglutarate/acetoin dehydrogenase E1 component
MTYKDELIRAMEFLAEDDKVLFLGQSVVYDGNSIYSTLKTIDKSKRIELPVFEETQMGMSIGLSMKGFIPVTCYPRWDFLILATNQLVNHLDKLEVMTKGKMNGGVIIRTAVGSLEPLDGGVQHTQNHTEAYEKMLTNTRVYLLEDKEEVFPAYSEAYDRAKEGRPSLLVEYGDNYSK